MKILLISGSPTRRGNAEQILDYIETCVDNNIGIEKVTLSGKQIAGCTNCGYCKKNKACSINDSMDQIYPALESADAIILVSPVYMGSMTGQLKCLIDRSVMLRRQGFLLKDKPCAVITLGGSRNGGQELTIQNIHAAMLIHGMIMIGDSNHFGGIVHVPWVEDEVGKQSIKDTIDSIIRYLNGNN